MLLEAVRLYVMVGMLVVTAFTFTRLWTTVVLEANDAVMPRGGYSLSTMIGGAVWTLTLIPLWPLILLSMVVTWVSKRV